MTHLLDVIRCPTCTGRWLIEPEQFTPEGHVVMKPSDGRRHYACVRCGLVFAAPFRRVEVLQDIPKAWHEGL